MNTENQKQDADKLEEERKIQADKDAEIAAYRKELEVEKQRKDFEEKERQDAENHKARLAKELANAGDKEKIKAFFNEYVALIDKFPTLTSEDGKLLQSRATEALLMVKKLIIDDSKKLV